MAYITVYKAEHTPNFLESEVGLVLKTAQVDDTGITADEYGFKTVKGGTVWPSNDTNAEGIVFEDVDVTHGERAASVITGGRIYKSRLPETLQSAAETALKAKGIVFVDEPPAISRVIVDAIPYTAGTTGFTAANIAEADDGSELTITSIKNDNDKAIATVQLSSGTVTATKVKAGSTQITCVVSDVNGKTTDITVPITIS